MTAKPFIEVDRDHPDDLPTAIRFGGESLKSDDGETWVVPKGLISPDLLVEELPLGVRFELCEQFENDVMILSTIPTTIERVQEGGVLVALEDSGTRKYWDGNVGFKAYMEAKKAAVEDRATQEPDFALGEYDDDGAWIRLSYRVCLDVVKVRTVVELAEQIVAEIEGAAEMRLGVELGTPTKAEDEKDFTLRTVLPIVRKLGFSNVRYHHGKREFGRDLLFARTTEFQELEHWGAQVKFGDVAGGANSEIDYMLGQIDDAFKMPFYDLYTRQQQRISKLAVIISGRFTENAIEKICEKIESHAIRNNLIFVDGEKIQTLAERFSRPLL